MNNIKISRNPFLIFLPFLAFYVAIVIIFHVDSMNLHGDEERYYNFAQNLIHGFYSPPPPDINLTNGPGYPIILIPFVALGLSTLFIALTNAIFYYLSVVFLFKAARELSSFRIALIFALFWACYYNSYADMIYVLTESFTCFLIAVLIFALLKAYQYQSSSSNKSRKYVWLSGFLLGYLVLTKIIFGYVLAVLLIACIFLFLLNRKNINNKKSIFIIIIAFFFTLPYLIYTYNFTGKIFYLGSPGSDSLYWMSTPYKNEYGDWYGDLSIKPNQKDINRVPGYLDSLKLHHDQDYEKIFKYVGTEREEIFRNIAISNIKTHPVKYLENCFSNIGRLLFSYPYSYTLQNNKTLLRIPLNGIILLFSMFCLILTFVNWQKTSFAIKFLLFFVSIYLGGTILVTAEVRMFTIIVPILLTWFAYIFDKAIKINFKFNNTD